MKRHTITDDDLLDWRKDKWVQFAASFGEFSKKTLECSLDELYRVTDHGKVLYLGGDASAAIRVYNDAR